jgi:hypothetical protein
MKEIANLCKFLKRRVRFHGELEMIRRKSVTVYCNILLRCSSKYNEEGLVKRVREIPFGLFTRAGDRIPVGARFSAPVQTGPEAHPATCTMGTRSFPGVSCGRGVTLNPHPLLVPRLKL